MRRIILATVSIVGLMGLGASVTTFPSLWAPRAVEGGTMFPLKGAGFLPSTPVIVCSDDFVDCMATTTNGYGEFIQSRLAPEVPGFLSLKAIQAPPTRGNGTVGKVITASVTVSVKDALGATTTDRLKGEKGY